MTGLDLLREELIKRGATRQQTESKLVAMTLDVIANTGTENADVWRKEVDETAHLRKTMQEKKVVREGNLTGGDVKPMEELKKINKKLFNERF